LPTPFDAASGSSRGRFAFPARGRDEVVVISAVHQRVLDASAHRDRHRLVPEGLATRPLGVPGCGMAVLAVEFGTVSEFIDAIAWPAVTIVVVLLFLAQLRKLLERPDVNVTVPGGLSITAKSQQAATGALVTASALRDQDPEPDVVQNKVEKAAGAVASTHRTPRLLWVDDEPSNNRYEKVALEALGISVDQSTTTEDALDRNSRDGPYDVVVSDMGRPGDARAGYTLLDKMRANGDRTPYVVYSGSTDPKHYDEAVSHGAVGSTALPADLLDMVVQAIRASGARRAAGS
jgi:CheY-like chemotaxis protein